jgi:rhamnosyltransferase
MIKYKVGIATVFYNPNINSIILFKNFADSGYRTVITNNGIDDSYLELLKESKNIILVGNGKNIGLAKGMNDAVVEVFNSSLDIDSVIMFDQDSLPDIDLPIQLQSSYFEGGHPKNIACLGPRLIDMKSNLNKVLVLDRYEEVLSLATSGTFVTRDNFKVIGHLKDDFFIDCLDHEWCFRAKNMGFRILRDNKLSMIHNMGENGLDWFGTYKPIYRSPMRHYYITRNTIAMLKKNYVPLKWKIIEFLKLIRRIIFYVIFSRRSYQSVIYIYNAIFDGLNGRMGEKK